MVDITHKHNTLREARAQATIVVSKKETIEALQNRMVPKGDVFEMAKAAGLLAVKNTWQVIPDCHPLPVEFAKVTYRVENLQVHIEMHVKTIYKTGVEVEAMHGASVVALTFYDMLKPIDKQIHIQEIKLLEKKGGKTDFTDTFRKDIRAAILVCSDLVKKGKKEDKAGKVITEKLHSCSVEIAETMILPDNEEEIIQAVRHCAEKKINLVILAGGTGITLSDVTTQAVQKIADKEIPGIMEYARDYGQQRTPYAMLSRSFAGLYNNTLLLAIPGSSRGAAETMDALFPVVLHAFKTIPV